MSLSDLMQAAGAERTILARARVPAAFLPGGAPAGADLDPDGAALLDVAVERGTIAAISPADPIPAESAIDLAGRHLWPRLVDLHAHLDKGHIADRTPNPSGDFSGAREATSADRIAY